jgi:hypothetical protein
MVTGGISGAAPFIAGSNGSIEIGINITLGQAVSAAGTAIGTTAVTGSGLGILTFLAASGGLGTLGISGRTYETCCNEFQILLDQIRLQQDIDFIPDVTSYSAKFFNDTGGWYCFWLTYNVAISRGVNPGVFAWYGDNISLYGGTISSTPIVNTAGWVFYYAGNPATSGAGHVSYYEYHGGNNYWVWETTGANNPSPHRFNINTTPNMYDRYNYIQFIPLEPAPNTNALPYIYPYNHNWLPLLPSQRT